MHHHDTTDNSKLTGTIPTEMGRLSDLQLLYLCTCFGVVRSALVRLSLALPLTFGLTMRHHDMTDNNDLAGTIPTEIGLAVSLTRFYACKSL